MRSFAVTAMLTALLASGALADHSRDRFGVLARDISQPTTAGFTLFDNTCAGPSHPAPTAAVSKYCLNLAGPSKNGQFVWPTGTGPEEYQAVFYDQPGCAKRARKDKLYTAKKDGSGECLANVWARASTIGGPPTDGSVWLAPKAKAPDGEWPS